MLREFAQAQNEINPKLTNHSEPNLLEILLIAQVANAPKKRMPIAGLKTGIQRRYQRSNPRGIFR